MDYKLTNEEISSLERYQENDFKIINTLLREGLESEININNRNGKGYPVMTRDLMDKALDDIKNLYSAIMKLYIKNGCQRPNKQLYRGTNQSLIKLIDNTNVSFFSTTMSINRTLSFSRKFLKGSHTADDTDMAILLIDSDVPWINIEEVLGGFEDEILFVPSKIQITETDITQGKKHGKEYRATLSEIDIPLKSKEEINEMREQILSKTEQMNMYLKYILVVKDNKNFNNNPRTLSVIKEYEDWKRLVVEYNHQQYKIIKDKFLNTKKAWQKDEELSDLKSKVEQEHLDREVLDSKKEELYYLRMLDEIKQENPELFDLSSIFDESDDDEIIDSEKIEHTGRKVR